MDELMELTLAQLRDLCKKNGVPFTGNKTQLATRLAEAGIAPPTHQDEDVDEGDVFTSDDPELTAVAGQPLPDADPAGYGPDSVPLPAPSQGDDDLDDDPPGREGDVASEGHTSAPGEALRRGLVELLGLEDADSLTDDALLRTVEQRLVPQRDVTFTDDGDQPDTLNPAEEYLRGRREAINAAIAEIIATTGRAGGTLLKRVQRIADGQA